MLIHKSIHGIIFLNCILQYIQKDDLMKLLMSIVYVAIIGILAHYIGESLPRGIFSENKFPYLILPFERNGKIYEKVGIRKWKTKLPDMSRVMRDMLPKRVTYDATSDSVNALIKETCVAEFIHQWLCFFGIGIYIIWKDYVGVILTVVFIVCNIPFIMIQRYNRPHLIMLRDRLRKREEKQKSALTDTVM